MFLLFEFWEVWVEGMLLYKVLFIFSYSAPATLAGQKLFYVSRDW
jgi:hypothetical protein